MIVDATKKFKKNQNDISMVLTILFQYSTRGIPCVVYLSGLSMCIDALCLTVLFHWEIKYTKDLALLAGFFLMIISRSFFIAN